MSVVVVEVSSAKAMQVFHTFPRVIYRDIYRAPSFPVIEQSSPGRDLLFGRVEAQPFLAVKHGYAVGRIVACAHRGISDGTGFFGYFESLNEPAVAAALLEAAAFWLAARGRNKMIGPVDLSPHERLGLLVEGFRGHHYPGMPYNPPYYANLLEQCGLKTEVSLYAYHCSLTKPLPDRLARVAARAARTGDLCVRSINFRDLSGEGEMFSRIHNGSMNEIWGFAPLSPEEGSAIWKRLKGFYDPGLILVAEVSGEPAGLCLAMHPVRRSPFAGCFSARLAVLGVLPRYRFRGLEAVLIRECVRQARRRGISVMELSLVAENNAMMNRIIHNLAGAKKSRTYRIYKNN